LEASIEIERREPQGRSKTRRQEEQAAGAVLGGEAIGMKEEEVETAVELVELRRRLKEDGSRWQARQIEVKEYLPIKEIASCQRASGMGSRRLARVARQRVNCSLRCNRSELEEELGIREKPPKRK
jgi:hypothetical protein